MNMRPKLLLENPFAQTGVAGIAARWNTATLALTAVMWFCGLCGLLLLAGRVHVDIPQLLAVRLPLLQSHPRLIFAGESRTEYGVDPLLAEAILGQPRGFAVNIAYDAGEPLAFAAAARVYPDVFRQAHVVLSVAPFLFNEGVQAAALYPLDVAARLSLRDQLVTFLPMRIGTLIRFVEDSFAARLAQQQAAAGEQPLPSNGGLSLLHGTTGPWPHLGQHGHFANWNVSGPKSRAAVAALCEIAAASGKLTVVNPPWVPGDRSGDPVFTSREADIVALLREAGGRCGFDVVAMAAIPGLGIANYADELHVNVSGVPAYTRYLMSQIPR